jgi:hypothetical protein
MRTPYYGNTQKNKSIGVGSTIKDYDPSSWGEKKEDLPQLEEFDQREKLTPWQLDRFADRILWNDIEGGRQNFDEPVVLMFEHLHERRKREIYVSSGVPDSALMAEALSVDGQFMYWRTHPQGRHVNSLKQRKKNRASWYR